MTENIKQDIRSLSKVEIIEWLNSENEPEFREKQINHWIWNKGVFDFHKMQNISKLLLHKLKENFEFKRLKINELQKSKDGTLKIKLLLHDNKVIESVLIPVENRVTACISSQVGCSLSCKFCATGQLKNTRNLKTFEIFEQVVIVMQLCMKQYKIPLTNIVFMGMGEPLMNYKEVIGSIRKITTEKGLCFSAKRITLSTAGISKQIKRLADDNVKFNLALSLHAANNEKRNKIMPINENNSIDSLADALKYFYLNTKNEITLEYLLLNDFNDSIEDAKQLVAFQKKSYSKINLIEYNTVEGTGFYKSTYNKSEQFLKYLRKQGAFATIRKSRGEDIDAACGQLANKN